MERMVLEPSVREWAAHIVRGLGDNDLAGQIQAVAWFVRNRVTYIRDPAGQEYLVEPTRMLATYEQTGAMMGDCDDHVMLLNSLLGVLGFDTVCLGVRHSSSDYDHVISGVAFDGRLIQIDPCIKDGNVRMYADPLSVKSIT